MIPLPEVSLMSRRSHPWLALLLAFTTTAAYGAAPPDNRDQYGDSLPPGAVARLGSERFRMSLAGSRAFISPDARFVAVANEGYRDVECLDAVTGKPVRSFPGPGPLAFLGRGEQIAVWSRAGGAVAVYDTGTGKQIERVFRRLDHTFGFAVAGGRFAVFEPGEGHVDVCDRVTGRKVASISTPSTVQTLQTRAVHLALSDDGKCLVICGRGTDSDPREATQTVQVWDVRKGKEVRQIVTPLPVQHLALRPNGKELAVSNESMIWLHEPDTGKRKRRLLTAGRISALAYSPDGTWLVAVVGPGRVQVWSTRTGERLSTPRGPDSERPSVGFSRSGQIVACSSVGHLIVLWDVRTGRRLSHTTGHHSRITSLVFAGRDHLLSAAENDGNITWDLMGQQRRRQGLGSAASLSAHGEGRTEYVFSPGGRYVVAHRPKGPIGLYETATGQEVLRVPIDRLSGSPSVAFSGDEKVLAVADLSRINPVSGASGEAPIVSLLTASGETLPAIKPRGAQCLAVSPDGRDLAVLTPAGIALYRVETGKPAPLFTPEVRLKSFAPVLVFSSDGRYLLASPGDHLAAGTARHTIESGRFRGPVVFSPCGRALALVETSRDRWGDIVDTIILYELCTGQKRLQLSPGGGVTALAFSPEGRLLASGHNDGTGLLWDLTSGAGRASGKRPEHLWSDLASQDAQVAYRALLALQRYPAQTVRLARTHVRPARGKPLAATEVSRLIAQLDSDDFALRQRAEATLKARIEETEATLKQALAASPLLEARLRLQRLLAPSRRPLFPRELVLPLRVVELLERIGTPEARKLLAELAGGYVGSLLTAEAKLALRRLDRKGRR
jgi:WD40 repeat protein